MMRGRVAVLSLMLFSGVSCLDVVSHLVAKVESAERRCQQDVSNLEGKIGSLEKVVSRLSEKTELIFNLMNSVSMQQYMLGKTQRTMDDLTTRRFQSIENISNLNKDLSTQNSKSIKNLSTQTTNSIKTLSIQTSNSIKNLSSEYSNLIKNLNRNISTLSSKINDEVEKRQQDNNNTQTRVNTNSQEINNNNEKITELSSNQNSQQEAITELDEKMEGMVQDNNKTQTRVNSNSQEINNNNEKITELSTNQNSQQEAITELDEKMEGMVQDVKKNAEDLKDLAKVLGAVYVGAGYFRDDTEHNAGNKIPKTTCITRCADYRTNHGDMWKFVEWHSTSTCYCIKDDNKKKFVKQSGAITWHTYKFL